MNTLRERATAIYEERTRQFLETQKRQREEHRRRSEDYLLETATVVLAVDNDAIPAFTRDNTPIEWVTAHNDEQGKFPTILVEGVRLCAMKDALALVIPSALSCNEILYYRDTIPISDLADLGGALPSYDSRLEACKSWLPK